MADQNFACGGCSAAVFGVDISEAAGRFWLCRVCYTEDEQTGRV